MALDIDIGKLYGAAELSKKLAELGAGVQGKYLRQVVREAIKPALRQAEATIPVGDKPHRTYKTKLVPPGYAKMSLRLKTWVSRDKAAATAMIGVLPDAFYVLQFIELGTSKFPAAPWLTPAFEATVSPMTSGVAGALRKRIDRIAKARATPGYTPGSIRPEGMRGSSVNNRARITGRA